MSTVSAAGSGSSTYVSLALHTRVRTSPGVLSTAAATPVADGTGTGSAQAFSAFAQAILAVLPASAATDSTSAAPSTTGTGSATDATGTAASADATTVANALAAALGPSGTGAGGPAALLKQIAAAIDSASASLVQSGASADAVKGFASQFRTQLSQALDSIAASLTGPGAGSTPATTGTPAAGTSDGTAAADSLTGGATYQVTEKGTIRLQTQEGDVVTIRLRNSATVNYGATGAATGAAAYAQQSSYGSSRFSVSVQGNLNPAELGAINSVLGQVDTLANQFFSGNFADAFATASALQTDPTEIARVSIRLSESETLSVAGPASAPATPATPSTPTTPDPTTTASGATSVGGTGAPSTVTTTDPTAGSTAAAPASTDTTSGSTSTTPGASTTGATPTPASTDGTSATTPQTLFDAIFAYLKDVLATLGSTTQSGSVTISAKAKLDLLAGAVVGASLTVRESTGAGFLKNVTGAITDSGPPASTPTGSSTAA